MKNIIVCKVYIQKLMRRGMEINSVSVQVDIYFY